MCGCSFSSASLFLPAAGYCYDSDLNDAGDYGRYWSRSLNADYPGSAWNFYFEDGDQGMSDYDRCYGRSVRPVLVLPL